MFCGESPKHFAERMQIIVDWNRKHHWPHKFDPTYVKNCTQFRTAIQEK